MAARSGVSLDAVLRRYCAGHTLLSNYIIEEAERDQQLRGAQLQRLLRTQATLFDRLLAAVSEQYTHEAREVPRTAHQRLSERIERLLDGELADTSELAYDFDGHHLGLIAAGPEGEKAVRSLATALDRLLLLVGRNGGTVWAWLGGRRRLDPGELGHLIAEACQAPVSLAIGEPAQGLSGWRLTHRQARAALPIALHSSESCIRYGDIALLASALQDDLLTTSLRQLYLEPLQRQRDGGEVARDTLRAYFAAERNVSSTAAALGISRQAATARLSAIEERLGHMLGSCAAALEIALQWESAEQNARIGRATAYPHLALSVSPNLRPSP
jgi:hypothetical protein